jgi:hypothetical protein
LNQKEIEAAAIMMRIFLAGLSFNFEANYHELEEITQRALLEIETETPQKERPSLSPRGVYCVDCVFWCGRCTEPTLQGRKSVNRVASSDACERLKLKGR